jgi:hypothetical protein
VKTALISGLAPTATLRVFFISYVNIPTIEILIGLLNVFVEPRECEEYSEHVTD